MQADQFELHAQIEERHWWFVARRAILRRLLETVAPPSAETLVIDVGCGTGANLAALAGGYRAIGIDTSAAAIRLANKRFPHLEFRWGEAPHDLGPDFAEAHVVTLLDVLEHVPDDFALFSQLWAASRPGTLFLVTVPADPELWSPHDEAFGHYRRYTRERFERLWRDLPARPRLVSGLNARLRPVIRGVRWWNRRRGTASGEVGTDFRMPARPLNWALGRTFAGEAGRIVRALDGRKTAFTQGVSWLALLERGAGPVTSAQRPDDVEADLHQPELALSH